MKTSEVLNKAADLIETKGWGQGAGKRGLCVSNAIVDVLNYDYMDLAAHYAVMRHLGYDSEVWRVSAIFEWNDAPERTAAEVIEALRAAAVIEAARESDARILGDRPEPVEREVAVS